VTPAGPTAKTLTATTQAGRAPETTIRRTTPRCSGCAMAKGCCCCGSPPSVRTGRFVARAARQIARASASTRSPVHPRGLNSALLAERDGELRLERGFNTYPNANYGIAARGLAVLDLVRSRPHCQLLPTRLEQMVSRPGCSCCVELCRWTNGPRNCGVCHDRRDRAQVAPAVCRWAIGDTCRTRRPTCKRPTARPGEDLTRTGRRAQRIVGAAGQASRADVDGERHRHGACRHGGQQRRIERLGRWPWILTI